MRRFFSKSLLGAITSSPHLETTVYILVFSILHSITLTSLPVFADEAIYIRWAQLILEDPNRYAFFSMMDGKPPLFLWMLSAVLPWFSDPLYAGRLLSVFIGIGTGLVLRRIARILTGNSAIARTTLILSGFLPFWWFSHRMALMDGLLAFWLSLSLLMTVQIVRRINHSASTAWSSIPWILGLGVAFGAAMMTKTPALFFIPTIASYPFFFWWKSRSDSLRATQKLCTAVVFLGVGGVLGILLFSLLRVSPLFGALFARSSDFTFSLQEIVQGEWRYVLLESPLRLLRWLSVYSTIGGFFLFLLGFFDSKVRERWIYYFFALISFSAPLLLFGRVLHARYFLPLMIILTLAIAESIHHTWRRSKIIAGVCLFLICIQSLLFNIPSLLKVEAIPFTREDTVQYLTEWSAGFGNREVVEYFRSRVKTGEQSGRTIVLTEGYFGTLPDGITMYLYGRNAIPNLEVHGVGVAPSELPVEQYLGSDVESVFYVVNSHRFALGNTDNLEEILAVPRPLNGPKLMLYRVKL